jgi:hypothetical protein
MSIAGFDLRVVPLLWAITALLLLGAALLLWPNIPWGRLRRFWQRAPRLIGGVSGLACLIGGWWLIQALQLVELAAVLRWVVALHPPDCRELALAMDASTLGQRFTVLSIHVLIRGCAIVQL